MKRAGRRVATVLAVAVALVSALASTAGARSGGEQRAAATIKIGIVYSRTGALAAYGAQYASGLRWGLNYATKGTNKVGNNTIELIELLTGLLMLISPAKSGVLAARRGAGLDRDSPGAPLWRRSVCDRRGLSKSP